MSTSVRVEEILIAHAGDTFRATVALDDEFVIIPKYTLPEFKVIDRNGKPHVDCGSDWGTWEVAHVDRMKTTALEDVGAWLTAEKWRDDAAMLAKSAAIRVRRDEIAAEYTPLGSYKAQPDHGKKLINRIIELERKAS